MDNNLELISSIKVEEDFEELIRRFVQQLFGTDAFLVGGPWDGGRDLVWLVDDKESREAAQISIQKKNLESKLDEDLAKVARLVQNHSYPPMLTFFWSHALSASKQDDLKTHAKRNYRIQLEIYDANKIAQKITNDYPELLRFLFEEIHSIKAQAAPEVDVRERAFYEYLALSHETANLRGVVVESQVVSSLYGKSLSPLELSAYAEDLGLTKGKAAAIISELKTRGRITEQDGLLSLSISEVSRIAAIEARDTQRRSETVKDLRKILQKHTDVDLAENILRLIKTAYAASIDVQISEINLEPPKIAIIKKAATDIIYLLREEGGLIESEARSAAHELLTAAGANEYLSGYCSARLCIGLLNQKRLLQYIENRHFFIYLDAPVLIRYMGLLRFSKISTLDNAFRTVNALRECIGGIKSRTVRVTLEHLEETVRHLENAERISRFANDDVIATLGDSKNVFFNLYLRVKNTKPTSYNFHTFLEEILGYEYPGSGRIDFNELLSCAEHLLKLSSVEVIDEGSYVNDSTVNEFSLVVRSGSGKIRKRQTIINDIIACRLLGNDKFHIDQSGVAQTPLFVTWDNAQHDMRDTFRRKRYNYGDWLIYTPQRAVERLSMIALKIQSTTLADGVLAIVDEDYFRDSNNSLVDTLAALLGEDPVESGAVVSLVTKLARKVTHEKGEVHESELDGYNTLNEVLIFTQKSFSTEFSRVRKLFAQPELETELIDLLREASSGAFDVDTQNRYMISLRTLLEKSDAGK
ncbi:hypothetical protein [Burkholderia gladioli]|uniref:hypothetical protein n=1 Tax=Burkholderia gladioli TaxID=28095 RepID=UPI00163E79B0|nr:hypothetical protein [Burkholderia gladioli]